MIIYDLQCTHAHPFEGWFSSPADFEQQLEAGILQCPHCDSPQVRRVPSAVAMIHKHVVEAEAAPAKSTQVTAAASATPAPLTGRNKEPRIEAIAHSPRTLLRQLANVLIANSEDVGNEFAAEARRIHYAEAPARSIRGQISRDEYEALSDEGIEILHLPVLDKADLN